MEVIMYKIKASITKNEKLNNQFAHLAFTAERMASEIKCGQFVFIRINNDLYPLLRRPFSVAWVLGGEVNIVYKIVGKGTQLLSEKRVGDILDVMGPLGNGFTFHENKEIILVAGGIGIASLMSLMRMCVQRNVKLFYGMRTKDECIRSDFLHIPEEHIYYATEDGSLGTKGFVTEPLEEYLKKVTFEDSQMKSENMKESNENLSAKNMYIYTCGPMVMIRAITLLAQNYSIKGEANLEERMGCGVGACLGCATETSKGMQMVCKDGPVFTFDVLGG